ncbi:hypothetical protein POTOM_057374 [Populus tomentosa]|uniref:Uncharacterized protein n=1 Tax=Populus tomentosa TaxID=118781 RepID=A0A8X8C1P6_POPTO|nr:hypothetical protein POTOM_057374 [Populus tomentosa]
MTTRPHALPSTFQILARLVAVTPLSPFTPPLGFLYLSGPHALPPPSPPPLPLSPPHPPQIPLHNFLTAIAPPTLLRNIHDMGLQHFPRFVKDGFHVVSELVCETLYAWKGAVSPHLARQRRRMEWWRLL